jgi:hypothetical protein
MTDENSKRTRVEPIFRWLRDNEEPDWPTILLRLAEGISVERSAGNLLNIKFEDEERVPPTAARLAWMIRNASRLAPKDGRRYQEYKRVNHPRVREVLTKLDCGDATSVPRELRLETASCCDCLIECQSAVIWIEGKRNDWLSSGTEWDITRDQLARNLESVWSLASRQSKDYWLLICYERELKHHEECLIEGYRNGTWWAGLPHVAPSIRQEFRNKVGTIRWQHIADQWPNMKATPELAAL